MAQVRKGRQIEDGDLRMDRGVWAQVEEDRH